MPDTLYWRQVFLAQSCARIPVLFSLLAVFDPLSVPKEWFKEVKTTWCTNHTGGFVLICKDLRIRRSDPCVYVLCHLAKWMWIGKGNNNLTDPGNYKKVWCLSARGKYLGQLRWTWQWQWPWFAVCDLSDSTAVCRELRLWSLERKESTQVP